MNRYFIWALALVAIVSCQKEDNLNTNSSDKSVVFSSDGINTRTTTLNGVDVWEYDDRIGITTSGFDSDYTNVEYYTTATDLSVSSDFESFVADNTIVYPSSSGTVTFYAYYPYTASSFSDGLVTVSIDNQKSDLGAVDYMTASKEVSYTKSDTPEVALNFEHRLSKVVFNITVRSNLPEVSDFSAKMSDLYCEAQYDIDGVQVASTLANSKEVDVTSLVASDNRTVTVTAIVHPGYYDGKPSFIIDGKTYELGEFYQTFVANTIHTYEVSIGKENVVVSGSTIAPWDSDDYEDLAPLKEVWDGVTIATTFSGVEYNPSTIQSYEITNGEELAYIAQLVDNGDDLEGITFTMLNNIDLGDHQWSSIGSDSDSYYFNGTFNGDGFKIKRLYAYQSSWDFGLFECLGSSGTIHSLNVEGNLIIKAACGGIVGYNYGGTIDSCSFDGTITVSNYGSGNAGGIVGCNQCGVISNCYNKGTIKGVSSESYITTDCIGGIAGTHRGAWYTGDELTGKIYACYNLGTISSIGDQIGGVVGLSAQGAVIESCFNKGSVSGIYQVGGIVGLNGDSEVTNAYNMGDVSGDIFVGGVVGEQKNFHTNGSDLTSLFLDANCAYVYNVGNVFVYGGEVGGVIGLHDRYASYCYAQQLYYDGDKTMCGYYDSTSETYIVVNSTIDAIDDISTIEALIYDDMVGSVLIDKLGSGFTSDNSTNINDGYPILTAINY